MTQPVSPASQAQLALPGVPTETSVEWIWTEETGDEIDMSAFVHETVMRTEEFAPAFERARDSRKPALLHLKLDPQALTPNASLDALRAQGRAAK